MIQESVKFYFDLTDAFDTTAHAILLEQGFKGLLLNAFPPILT